MQNTKHNNVKKALLNKAHVKRWRRILLCLSCVVVFCTVYALILPAITLEKTAAEEHIHTEECYSNNGTLLCNLSEDSYEEENTLIQETDSTLPDSITDNEEEDVTDYTEIVSSTDAYVLPDEKISSLQLTYTKENKKVSISNNGVLDTPDTLDVDMVVSFEKLALSELKERSFIYTLPDAFLITDTSSRNITIADQIIGTYSPKVNGQVTVQYTQEYLNTLNDSVTMKSTFTLSTRIDLDKVDPQTGRIKVPQGNITLDLGKD